MKLFLEAIKSGTGWQRFVAYLVAGAFVLGGMYSTLKGDLNGLKSAVARHEVAFERLGNIEKSVARIEGMLEGQRNRRR